MVSEVRIAVALVRRSGDWLEHNRDFWGAGDVLFLDLDSNYEVLVDFLRIHYM